MSWSRITGLPNLSSDRPSHAPVKPANIFGQTPFFDVWVEDFAGTGKSRYQAVAVCGHCRSMSRGASQFQLQQADFQGERFLDVGMEQPLGLFQHLKVLPGLLRRNSLRQGFR